MRDERIDVDILKLFDGEPGLQIGTGGVKDPAHLGHPARRRSHASRFGSVCPGFGAQVQDHGRR